MRAAEGVGPYEGVRIGNPSASLRSAPLLCTRSADEIIDFEPHSALAGEPWAAPARMDAQARSKGKSGF